VGQISGENKNDKKWGIVDWVILIAQIAFPVIAILVVCLNKTVQGLSDDQRLSIIGAGLMVPIILQQVSITINQNKIVSDVKDFNQKLNDVSNDVKQISPVVEGVSEINQKLNEVTNDVKRISPMIEKVVLSDNEKFKRFAFRRIDAANKAVQQALGERNSGILSVSEYYDELQYLADLIMDDKRKNGICFSGEVWAMTSFAEGEWADEGYEKLWTKTLTDLVDMGIKTRRLCVIVDELYNVISSKNFTKPTDKKHRFYSFINHLRDYYKTGERKEAAKHYCIKAHDNTFLSDRLGFFAIKLTNGDLHILSGETVNSTGALSAKVLFDQTEILNIRSHFERYTNEHFSLEKVVLSYTNGDGFKKYLLGEKITLDANGT